MLVKFMPTFMIGIIIYNIDKNLLSLIPKHTITDIYLARGFGEKKKRQGIPYTALVDFICQPCFKMSSLTVLNNNLLHAELKNEALS